MNATTQLALLSKAKRVFETDGTFLSFPILSPLAYPPEKLQFIGPAADIHTLGEFSLAVNQIPRGSIFQQENVYLWDLYERLFRTAEVATQTATPEQVAAYERADAILHVTTPDGLRQDSAKYQAYKRCRDAWIAANEEYKAAQVTADASTDPAVKDQWQSTDEPALRQKVAQAETTWATEGFRAEVEDAERAVRAYAERPSADRLWEEWRDAFNPDVDTLTDPLNNQPFAPTAFSPADAFDAPWPKFTLTADEVAALVGQAPPELKEVLDLTGADPPVDSVAFEFRSVGLNRPWLRPEIFQARFWRLPATESPLSDGGSPPQGSCPAYITGVVFARNIVEVTRQPSGTINRVPIQTMPLLKLRPQFIQPRPALPSVSPVIRPASTVIRDHRTAALSAVADTRVARFTAVARPAVASAPVRSVSPLERLRMTAFKIQPLPLPPATPSPPPPPANVLRLGSRGPEVTTLQHALNAFPSVSPKVSEDGLFGPQTDQAVRQFQQANHLSVDGVVGPDTWSRLAATPPTTEITILAFICKRLPKCPDPDPSLTWTG